MVQGFKCLWHHAVIRRHHQYHNISDIGSARPHGTEGCMTWSIEECNLGQLLLPFRMRKSNGIGSNVLGNASSFTGGDVGFADHVQQSSLAMIDVTHNGHDWSACNELLGLVFDIELNFSDRGVDDATAALALLDFEPETVFSANFLGDSLIDGLINIGENARFHQVGNDFEWLLLELIC